MVSSVRNNCILLKILSVSLQSLNSCLVVLFRGDICKLEITSSQLKPYCLSLVEVLQRMLDDAYIEAQ